MASHEHSIDTKLPIQCVWEFVREMDHWAPMLTGYQSHQKQSETESTWTLKGDVGVLARTLRFQVLVTEWAGPARVCFALKGLNEPMHGEGSFRMEARGANTTLEMHAVAASPRGLAWLWDRFVRLVFRRMRKPSAARAAEPVRVATTRMTFALRIDPGGPMAPMIDALMRPAMAAAAEDLAQRIISHLEASDAAGSGTARSQP
jgi:carbon monoxide dehydrogenase subunit G